MYQLELMREARKLINNQQYYSAIKPLLSMREDGLAEDDLETKYIMLSTCYQYLDNHEEALKWATKATMINKYSEFASITKCEVHRNLKQFENAYLEMVTFSKDQKMGLYRVILLRFLKDIDSGVITDKSLIKKLNALAAENLNTESIEKHRKENNFQDSK